MSEVTCPECHGQRLRKEALAVTVGGINIARMGDMSVIEAMDFVDGLELNEKEHIIADRIIKEIKADVYKRQENAFPRVQQMRYIIKNFHR